MFQLLEQGAVSQSRYDLAVKLCRKVQKRAFSKYQRKLKEKLASMSNSGRNFWSLAKEISGLDSVRVNAAPDADDIADHFAEKMSNAAGEKDDSWCPVNDHSALISSFKIRYSTVLEILQGLDPSKSANGVGPRFMKECAVQLAPALTRLYKFIVNRAVYPTRWKIGRITPLHKKGAVSVPANYRPVTVLDNNSTCFETAVDDQFYSWIVKFIPACQYGFLRGCGTLDYGAMLAFKIQRLLETRGEGILIALYVKGGFDRCWWARLKQRFKAAGMKGRALKHRTTTSGTITSHGRCERVAERVHEATTTPLIANTQSHINQTENAAHANKTYCMLTNHPPPYHLHDIALVPCHARSFAEFAHKSFQAKRVCNPNTGRLVCKCTDWSTNTQTSLHGRLNHLISTSFVD